MLNAELPPTFTLTNSLASINQNPLQLLQTLWEGVSYGIFVLDVEEQGQEFRYATFNPAIGRSKSPSHYPTPWPNN